LLLELLSELPDLDGTGYDPGDVDDLQKLLAEPEFKPDGQDAHLDRKSVTDCPECGHTFTPITRTVTE
jgi:hypothetical protein